MPNGRAVRSRPPPRREAEVALLPGLQDAASGRGPASDLVHGEPACSPQAGAPAALSAGHRRCQGGGGGGGGQRHSLPPRPPLPTARARALGARRCPPDRGPSPTGHSQLRQVLGARQVAEAIESPSAGAAQRRRAAGAADLGAGRGARGQQHQPGQQAARARRPAAPAERPAPSASQHRGGAGLAPAGPPTERSSSARPASGDTCAGRR